MNPTTYELQTRINSHLADYCWRLDSPRVLAFYRDEREYYEYWDKVNAPIKRLDKWVADDQERKHLAYLADNLRGSWESLTDGEQDNLSHYAGDGLARILAKFRTDGIRCRDHAHLLAIGNAESKRVAIERSTRK